MANIVLGAVTLTDVLEYGTIEATSFGTKKVPGKMTPTVDTNVTVIDPVEIKIVARVTASTRTTLRGYKGTNKTLTDEDGSITVRVKNVDSDYEMGYERPWIVSIICAQVVY